MAAFITNHREPYPALSAVVSAHPLAGKSVFVTGGGRGVGEHIARAIAQAGAARVGLLGRNKERIEKTKDAFAKSFPGTTFYSYAVDITDAVAVDAAIKEFGAPDVLINNAGHFPDEGAFIKQDLKSWWSGYEINVLGTVTVTQAVLKAKGPETPVTILNVSSFAAHMRFPLQGWSGYTSSKTAQARIFEYLRFEHPEVRFVNAHPGQIASDGFTRSGAPPPEGGMTNGEVAGQFFVWLATKEAEFLNGRFVWAEWDIDELKAKKDEIVEKDQLLFTIDGFKNGFF